MQQVVTGLKPTVFESIQKNVSRSEIKVLTAYRPYIQELSEAFLDQMKPVVLFVVNDTMQ